MARTRTTYPNFDDLLFAWRKHLESGAPPENCAGWKTRNGYICDCGEVIYSYGKHYPLARCIQAEDSGEQVYIVNATGYSRTTEKHIRETLNRLRPSVGYLDGSRRDLAAQTIPPNSASEWVRSLLSAARKDRAQANRRRDSQRREWDIRSAEKHETDARTLAGWLGVSWLVALESSTACAEV